MMEQNMIFNNLDGSIKSSVRYKLVHKMMEENFLKWVTQSSTMNMLQKLVEDCKKPNISLVNIIF